MFRITEAVKAIVAVENYSVATSQTTLRSLLGRVDLDTLLAIGRTQPGLAEHHREADQRLGARCFSAGRHAGRQAALSRGIRVGAYARPRPPRSSRAPPAGSVPPQWRGRRCRRPSIPLSVAETTGRRPRSGAVDAVDHELSGVGLIAVLEVALKLGDLRSLGAAEEQDVRILADGHRGLGVGAGWGMLPIRA